MFYLSMAVIFLIVAFKQLKGYFQFQTYLKYKEPSYIEYIPFKANSMYESSVNGVLNTHDYQNN